MILLRMCLLVLILTASSSAQDAHAVRSSGPGGSPESMSPSTLMVVRGVNQDMHTFVPPPPGTGRVVNATFEVTYNGFPAPAQTAFQHAVNIWASLLVSPVPIKVTANWTALPPGVLGSAGATAVYRDFPNAPQPGTWYAVAAAEKLAGVNLNGTGSEITANFSSSIGNWYFGTDGNTPPGQFDLVSIVLHELGHGLSFFGSMTVSSGQGSWGNSTPYPFIYDRYAENGANQSLLNTSLFPNPSIALATQLQSNSVYFDGPEAVVANGGIRPRLYAPGSWIAGSSYSHLDEATYPAGTQNSLMTPQFGTAEAMHNPGPVTLGMCRDMGWTTTAGASNIKFEERFGTSDVPPGWRIVDNDGGGLPLSFRQLVVFQSGDTVRPQTGASFWFGSFNGANGSGRIDEWLIGPRVNNITAGDSLYFYAGAIGGQYNDSLRVFISTTDSSLGSFTNLIGYFRVAGPVGSWHEYRFDLSPFAGSHIFFAVNYFIVNGGPSGTHSDNVWIDHFFITTDNPTSVRQQGPAELPGTISLAQNYPNPFNPSTKIVYQVKSQVSIELNVFDVLGRKIATLVNEVKAPGSYEVTWDASGMSSGVYFYRLQAAGFAQTKRLVLMR